MFYKKYHWQHTSGKTGETLFSKEHFSLAGIYRPEEFTLGMPELEALRLINHWNHNDSGWRYWV